MWAPSELAVSPNSSLGWMNDCVRSLLHDFTLSSKLIILLPLLIVRNARMRICTSPVKNLSSQLTHWELTLKIMVGSFWGHSVSSRWTHKMTLTVSLLWAFREFVAIHEIIPMSSVVAVSSLLVGILWAHRVNSLRSHSDASQWVSQVSSLWVWC